MFRVGLEGLYPRPKLVATDPNSWEKKSSHATNVFLGGFFCLLLNFATLELIKGCISNIIQRKTEENPFLKNITFSGGSTLKKLKKSSFCSQ